MSEYRNTAYYGVGETLNEYVTKVFVNMALGLAVTTVVAIMSYISLINGGLMYQILISSSFLPIVLVLVQFGVVIALSAGLARFSSGTIRLLFFAYAALTGVTFSTLPLAYGVSTVFTAFMFAGVLFGSCAVIGKFTGVDMTKFRGLLMGALMALCITTLVSIFIPVLRESLLISYLGLGIFLALTAYDMQMIERYYYNVQDGMMKRNLAVYAAFQLYLDFINIFLRVLRILGSRNSRR